MTPEEAFRFVAALERHEAAMGDQCYHQIRHLDDFLSCHGHRALGYATEAAFIADHPVIGRRSVVLRRLRAYRFWQGRGGGASGVSIDALALLIPVVKRQPDQWLEWLHRASAMGEDELRQAVKDVLREGRTLVDEATGNTCRALHGMVRALRAADDPVEMLGRICTFAAEQARYLDRLPKGV